MNVEKVECNGICQSRKKTCISNLQMLHLLHAFVGLIPVAKQRIKQSQLGKMEHLHSDLKQKIRRCIGTFVRPFQILRKLHQKPNEIPT